NRPPKIDIFFVIWYNVKMEEIIKSVIGFIAILIVGLAGVTVSEVMRLGDMNALIMTVDNVSHTR
ncbi:MAG: hypothetical protein WAZ40_03315, partial [Minisyncoccia bacterium]